jgi:4-amino-4-deoxychorismate lyase
VADLRVLALLDEGLVPADTPILRADDLGTVRGDGIFETMHARVGQAWLRYRHLDRMAASADRMQLQLPARPRLDDLIDTALSAWPVDQEGALRLVCTRGLEDGDGRATVFATVSPVGGAAVRARANGVAVVTASLGLPMLLRADAPWLLGGAKTLSYAVNMASLRWAQTQGADDVLWVSAEGYALEAPTSTLVWLRSGTLYCVPVKESGILAGITAAWLLEHAGELGWRTDEALITPAELATGSVEGAWFTSSVRGVAPLRTLDGAQLPQSAPATAAIQNLLGFTTPA